MRRAIALTLVIPLLLAIPLISGCQSESKKHLYKAEDYFEKKDFENAQKELRLAIQAEAISVILDLVKPDRVIRNSGRAGRQAKMECAGHCRKTGVPAASCESALPTEPTRRAVARAAAEQINDFVANLLKWLQDGL